MLRRDYCTPCPALRNSTLNGASAKEAECVDKYDDSTGLLMPLAISATVGGILLLLITIGWAFRSRSRQRRVDMVRRARQLDPVTAHEVATCVLATMQSVSWEEGVELPNDQVRSLASPRAVLRRASPSGCGKLRRHANCGPPTGTAAATVLRARRVDAT